MAQDVDHSLMLSSFKESVTVQKLRKLPRWAMILSSCVAAVAVAFIVLGLIAVLTGAGTEKVLFNGVAALAFGIGAWSIAVKGNPELSRGTDAAPLGGPGVALLPL
ncbi:hypothetical protein [Arthrobacter psychrochitiniphilus]|uniref:hypothetical protein n=1 Tax=Arthrobacter psychrochitiniphilus TaxID=291045 RepID=UPI003F7CCBAF